MKSPESPPPPAAQDSPAELAESLRRDDRDRYLTALLAPSDARDGLFAVYAFNLEIARIRETVSEPIIGHMRLQWWRDRLDDIFAGRPPKHPVAEALAGTVGRFSLARAPFEALLTARERDLDDEPPATLDDLADYARATAAPVMEAALAVLGDAEALAAVPDAALAQGLTGMLRAVPFLLRGRRLMLPADLCAAAGLSAQRLYDRGPGAEVAALAQVVGAVAARAEAALTAARARPVSRRSLPALLPARLAARDLKRLRAAAYNPFDGRVLLPDGLRPLVLLTARLAGRF